MMVGGEEDKVKVQVFLVAKPLSTLPSGRANKKYRYFFAASFTHS